MEMSQLSKKTENKRKRKRKRNDIFLHYGVSLTPTNNLHATVGRPTAGLQTFPGCVSSGITRL